MFVRGTVKGLRTVNTKRNNRPPQIEMDHDKEEKALRILNDLNVFQRIANGDITLMDFVPEEEDPTVEIDDEEDADAASENASFTFTKEGEEEEDGDDDMNVSPDQEGQDTTMESQEDTEREQKRRRITDMIDRMREQADIDGICLACGEEGHNADACDKDRNVSDALDRMGEMFKPQEKPVEKTRKTKKHEKKRDSGAGAAGKRLLENEIFTQFEDPVLMTTIGDNEKGGEYLVNHVDTGEFGPKNIIEMEDLIDMAIERSKHAILPDIDELLDDSHQTINSGHPGYAKINVGLSEEEKTDPNLARIFKVAIVPLVGVEFHMSPWSMNCTLTGSELERKTYPAEDSISHRCCGKLRHGVGALQSKNKNGDRTSGLPCNEGYWVNIETLLYVDGLFGERWQDIHASERWNRHYDRLRTIVKVNHREREWKKRIRFEILALTTTIKDLKGNPLFMQNHGIDVQYIVRQYGNAVEELSEGDTIWLKPIAIRASQAHTPPERCIQFQPWRTSLMIDRQCSLSLGGAYHATSLNNLVSIMKNGLMPGGLGDRTTTFMLPFGPWDSRSMRLVKRARMFHGEKRICLYLRSRTS